MRTLWTLLCVISIAGIYKANGKDYTRFRLVRAVPNTTQKLTSLAHYLNKKTAQGDVDVWNLPREVNNDVTFTLSSDSLRDVRDWLHRQKIRYHVDKRDLQSIVKAAEERDMESLLRKSRVMSDGVDLDVYHDHNEINEYLQSAADRCDVCGIINMGQSYEGRDMNVIRIGKFGNNKKAIFIDAGIHAREWIAPATALKLVNNFVEGYVSGDQNVEFLLDNYVWLILPSANPDGYMYSRTEDRFWRKTRRPNGAHRCVGTDPNRNWSFHWNETGTSPDHCSDIYPGPNAFSETETQNMKKFLLERQRFLQVYISLHSYGQFWLYPWGFDSSLPANWRDLDDVGDAAVDAIYSVDGKAYTLGSSTNVLYAAAGASDDWAKGVARIEYSYTVELRDDGRYGFLLPPEQIEPTAREIWEGIIAMVTAIKDKEYTAQSYQY